jgi:hypothetical protein
MYRLPWYGQFASIKSSIESPKHQEKNVRYALTALASATLLNLNGLKSSLTCTGVFLSPTFPKKGLGTGGEVEDCRESWFEITGLRAVM